MDTGLSLKNACGRHPYSTKRRWHELPDGSMIRGDVTEKENRLSTVNVVQILWLTMENVNCQP